LTITVSKEQIRYFYLFFTCFAASSRGSVRAKAKRNFNKRINSTKLKNNSKTGTLLHPLQPHG
jgi:hypothetical protein